MQYSSMVNGMLILNMTTQHIVLGTYDWHNTDMDYSNNCTENK